MSSFDEGNTEESEDASSDVGAGEVKSAIDAENEQGFRGVSTDQTPNHAYTVAGVGAGEETPESKASKAEDK